MEWELDVIYRKQTQTQTQTQQQQPPGLACLKPPILCNSEQNISRGSPATVNQQTSHSLLVLLDDIMFRTPLLRLSVVVSQTRFILSLSIPHQSLERALRAALHTLSDPAAVILQLALRLLTLPLRVLLPTLFLEFFRAEQAAEAFLGGPDRLVVAALGPGRVVGRDTALRGGGEWAHFADGVGEVFFVGGSRFGIGGIVL